MPLTRDAAPSVLAHGRAGRSGGAVAERGHSGSDRCSPLLLGYDNAAAQLAVDPHSTSARDTNGDGPIDLRHRSENIEDVRYQGLRDVVVFFVLEPVGFEVDEVLERVLEEEGVGLDFVADGGRRSDAEIVAGPYLGFRGEFYELVQAVPLATGTVTEIRSSDLADEQRVAGDEFAVAQRTD
jgi:hypothetical protein